MSFTDKLRFLFSGTHFSIVCRRLGYWWRYHVRRKTRIRLAVVGTTSSGKSFLLQDILTSLKCMAGIFSPLETTMQSFRDFGNYSPDEKGGEGGTPLYACRQGNHYGAAVKHNTPNRDSYDMDFLNIPGEIFEVPKSGLTRLKAYTNLRDKLRKAGRVFTVTLWKSDTDDMVWIVEPVAGWTTAASDRAATMPGNPKSLVMSYKTWSQIFSELNVLHFRPVRGSARRISGASLLKHFFEYDTDSAIRSIHEWIRSNAVTDLGFYADDFSARAYDNSFTFFHYCTMATDIVVCDRIFTKDQAPDEMSFGDLTRGLDSFIKDCSESKSLHVYLAFRNVDFIMYPREGNYKILIEKTLSDQSPEKRNNAIYSLFAYSMLHYLNPQLEKTEKEMSHFLGIPPVKISAATDGDAVTETTVTADIGQLMKALLDVEPAEGFLQKDTPDLQSHINSRLGDSGHAFRMLLTKTQVSRGQGRTPIAQIVPHVYFSSTPITSNYDIYRNFTLPDGRPASDFVKVINGKRYFFHNQNSNACFGSYQLAMDILTQHGLGNFKVGDLLRIMQGKI